MWRAVQATLSSWGVDQGQQQSGREPPKRPLGAVPPGRPSSSSSSTGDARRRRRHGQPHRPRAHHNRLALVLGPVGHLDCRLDRRARADAHLPERTYRDGRRLGGRGLQAGGAGTLPAQPAGPLVGTRPAPTITPSSCASRREVAMASSELTCSKQPARSSNSSRWGERRRGGAAGMRRRGGTAGVGRGCSWRRGSRGGARSARAAEAHRRQGLMACARGQDKRGARPGPRRPRRQSDRRQTMREPGKRQPAQLACTTPSSRGTSRFLGTKPAPMPCTRVAEVGRGGGGSRARGRAAGWVLWGGCSQAGMLS